MANAFTRRQMLRRWWDSETRRRRQVGDYVELAPFGGYRVVRKRDCSAQFLMKSATPDISVRPGTAILGARTAGGSLAFEAAPSGRGGAAPAQNQEDFAVVGPELKEFLSLVRDPTDTDQLHILLYREGSYVERFGLVDFDDGVTLNNLATAASVRGVAGTDDGFAFLTFISGQMRITRVDETGAFIHATTTTGATGFGSSGSIHIADPYLYVGGVIDLNASPDEIKVFRATLPDLSSLIEVGSLVLPGGSSYSHYPGVWLPDRHRHPESAASVWVGLDDTFLDPAAVPQTQATSDTVHTGTPGLIYPLGHNGASTGYYAWKDGADIRFWSVGSSGNGFDLSFSTDWQDDFMQIVVSGPWSNRWVTAFQVYGPGQSAAVSAPRAAAFKFSGSAVDLPLPFDIDIATPEGVFGWGAGDGWPLAWLPRFP